MKVFGNLERASLEVLSSNPSAGVLGRVWFNSTDGRPYIDESSVVRAILVNDDKLIVGNSGTAAQNIRLHRGAAGVLQFVTGSDATAEGTLSTSLNLLSFRFEGYTDALKPAFGNAGRVVYLTDLQNLFVDTGTAWNPVGSGGGGGGGANWRGGDPAPLESEEYNEKVWMFQQGAAQQVVLYVKVPTSYAPGRQIRLAINQYSPSAADTQLLSAVSTLVRRNTDAINSTSNQHTSTNAALTNTVALQSREAIIDLTSSTGTINGVAVAASDLIKVVLSRGTDTDTADVRFVPSSTELRFS